MSRPPYSDQPSCQGQTPPSPPSAHDPVSTVDESPSPRHGSPPAPETLLAERYELLGEIAHGGMGVVMRCRDHHLNRDLALKVLHESVRDRVDVVRRFLEEAEITGQLQHPAIVPIHERGTLPDGRPFFAMKLVEGHTLAELLKQRPEPSHERQRFLNVFLQVCQAVAFAHSKGVIHRDLKPTNVMVGAFGEVQVMDWGLAKVLTRPDVGPAGEGPVSTDDAATQAGAVMGTFAYMPPEQARGEVERVDRRSDVFGLGAILCEVLTGGPPYSGKRDEVSTQARQGHITPAFERLEKSGADAELIALAKRCLAAERNERPTDAGQVAADTAAYLASVDERARQAEQERAAAEARAEEERKRRRVTAWLLGASGVAALAVLGLAFGLTWAAWLNSAYQSEAAARSEAEAAKSAEEEQRQKAEGAKAEEEVQRKKAEAAQKVAEDAQTALQRSRDLQKGFFAAAALRDNDVRQARVHLEECPPELRGWEWHYVNGQCHTALLALQGSPQSPRAAVFSPDGRRIAIQRDATTVTVHDAWTGKELFDVKETSPLAFTFGQIVFSPDGERIATRAVPAPGPDRLALVVRTVAPPAVPNLASALASLASLQGCQDVLAPRIQLYDARTGQETLSFPRTASATRWVFSPDGGRITIRGDDGVLRVFDVRTGRELRAMKGGAAIWTQSPDGSRLAAGGGIVQEANKLTVFDARTGQEVSIIKANESLLDPVFSPDGTLIASGSPSGWVRVYDCRTGKEGPAFPGHYFPQLIFSPDGSRLAVSPMRGGPARVFDVRAGQEVGQLKLPPRPDFNPPPAFSPDGTRIAEAGTDGVVRVYDVQSGAEVRIIQEVSRLSHPTFSPDGARVAAVGKDGVVRVYDAGVVRAPLAFYEGDPANLLNWHRGRPPQAVFSADGSQFVFEGAERRGQNYLDLRGADYAVWRADLRTAQVRRIFLGPNFRGVWSSLSPEGSWIAVSFTGREGRPDGVTEVYDARTGKRTATLQGLALVLGETFSPDGTRIATCGRGETVWVYDPRNGSAICALKRSNPFPTIDPVFSPDGTRLADLDQGLALRVYDLRDGREAFAIKGPFLTTRFSPDSKRVVAAADGMIRWFDAETGQEVLTSKTPPGVLALSQFTRDGTRLAAMHKDGTVLVYDTASGREVLSLKVDGRFRLWLPWGPVFSPDGSRIVIGTREGGVRMFDALTGQEAPLPQLPEKLEIGAAADERGISLRELQFSPDGRWLSVRSAGKQYLFEAPCDLEEHRGARRDRLQAALPAWHFDHATRHEQAGYLFGTLFHLRRLSDLSPGDPRVTEAVRIAEHRLDLDRKLREIDDVPALDRLAWAFKDKGQLDDAVAACRRAIELDPKNAVVHLTLAEVLHARGDRDAAVVACRKALALDPAYAFAHNSLGWYLMLGGQVDEAIWEFRTAIELNPRYALPHNNLGVALRDQGQLDDAMEAYRAAVAIAPGFAAPHRNLGVILRMKGQLDEAVGEFRKAVELDPRLAVAHHDLGTALLDRGQYAEAREATSRALEFLPERDSLREQVVQQMQRCDRLLALDKRLPDLLRGEVRPADLNELLLLAEMCRQQKKLYAAAARFYAAALDGNPNLAGNLANGLRYSAARCAVLAGCGKGEDAAKLDDKERLRLRAKALDWLKADLALWEKVAGNTDPKTRAAAEKQARRWQEDPDLALVRDKEALTRLPEAERDRWHQFWADVGGVLKKSLGMK